jgi:hypothetical protein
LKLDQVNCSLSLDTRTVTDQYALAPHKSAFDLEEPRQLSSVMMISKPVVSTIANWLSEEDELTPQQIRQMEAIPDAP